MVVTQIHERMSSFHGTKPTCWQSIATSYYWMSNTVILEKTACCFCSTSHIYLLGFCFPKAMAWENVSKTRSNLYSCRGKCLTWLRMHLQTHMYRSISVRTSRTFCLYGDIRKAEGNSQREQKMVNGLKTFINHMELTWHQYSANVTAC